MIDDLAKSGRFNYAMSDFCLVESHLEHLQGKRHRYAKTPSTRRRRAPHEGGRESKLYGITCIFFRVPRTAAAAGARHRPAGWVADSESRAS